MVSVTWQIPDDIFRLNTLIHDVMISLNTKLKLLNTNHSLFLTPVNKQLNIKNNVSIFTSPCLMRCMLWWYMIMMIIMITTIISHEFLCFLSHKVAVTFSTAIRCLLAVSPVKWSCRTSRPHSTFMMITSPETHRHGYDPPPPTSPATPWPPPPPPPPPPADGQTTFYGHRKWWQSVFCWEGGLTTKTWKNF